MPLRCLEPDQDKTRCTIRWSQGLIYGGHKVGLEFAISTKLDTLLHEAGFTNVENHWQDWPIGSWAKGDKNKAIGKLWAEDLQHVSRSTSAMFTRVLDWTEAGYSDFADQVSEEIRAGGQHMWGEM